MLPAWLDDSGSPELPSEAEFCKFYQDGMTIGKGRFAKVRMVTDRKSGKSFAAKLVSKHIYQDKRDILLRELQVMCKLDHQHVVKLYGAYESDDALILVCDLARGGDLSDRFADGSSPFSADQARRLITSLLSAVGYLHSAGICHRDLKPENILLSDETADAAPIVADFGLARSLTNRMQRMITICGSRQYVAPEIIKCERGEETSYDSAVDVWGVGIVTFFVLFGQHPFMQDANVSIEAAITSGRLAFPRYAAGPEARDIVKQMLAVRPLQRITVENALRHPWITQKLPPAPALVQQIPAARIKPLAPMAPSIPSDLAYNAKTSGDPPLRTRSCSSTCSSRQTTRASHSDAAFLDSRHSSTGPSPFASPSASLDFNFSEISISSQPHSRVHPPIAPRGKPPPGPRAKVPAFPPAPRSKSLN